ncbi:MFS transporter [Chloroflexota bacterium]
MSKPLPVYPTSEWPRAPERPGQISNTIAYYISFLALGLAIAAMGPTLPYLADQTDSPLSAISSLFTTHALGYLLISLLAGRLYDRAKGHPVMAVALIVMAVTLAVVPLTPLLWLLVLVFLVLGMAQATVDIGGNTLLVWVHHDRVGPFMNGLHFFFGLGAFLTPILVAQVVLASDGIVWAYWILALLALPVAVWLLILPSPVAAADPSGEPLRQRDGTIAEGKRGILVGLFAAFLFFYVGAEIGFAGWLFSYAVVSGLASATNAAYLTSAFWGALTLGRLLAIPVSARARPSFILLGDMVGCLISLSIIILSPDSPEALLVGAIGMGLSMASVFPVIMSLAERRMTVSGLTTGWFFFLASIGAMSLPWIMGQLFERISPLATMVAILIVVLADLGILIALLAYSSRHSVNPVESTAPEG